MKTIQHLLKFHTASVLLFIIGLLSSVRTFAQEKNVTVKIDTGHQVPWYNLWWIWVIGGALFVIALVAIVSAGKKT